MMTPHRWIARIGSGIAAVVLAGVVGGCAARAEYVYDEPVVYRRERVYRAPPPAVIVHDHPRRVERHYHVAPRVHRAPPPRVYRSPPARHRHHDRDRDDDDRRERRHHHH